MNKEILNWIQKKHIKLILFDLDDTLIDTNNIFVEKTNRCVEIITNADKTVSLENVTRKINELDEESYHLMHGDFKRRWPYVVESLAEAFVLNTAIQEQLLQTLQSITTVLPKLKFQAKETLQLIRQLPVKMGIVTQANEDWTMFKLNGLDLTKYFDHIFPVGADLPKSAASWRKSISFFKIRPSETVVVGDSLKSDIISAREAGVIHIFWIKEVSGWTHAHQGKVPKGIIEVDGISNIIKHIGTPFS